ncbi:transcriptional regulator [Bacillus cereus]|uniref:Transcriptional regulator n=1 Tax=Bacillus cereus TaxID=1396 RepID=A0A1S9T2V5_BACCE|nr:metalloregulator ArsR/SmtB family transcription factor [Bacillus cereus]OOR04325.1 transcriptional regulator [Bacillus cereus]
MRNTVSEKDIDMLKALAHPSRLKIVTVLLSRGCCNVKELVEVIQLPQSTVSQHLTKLRVSEVVKLKKSGVESYYFVENLKVKSIIEVMLNH